MSGAGTPSIASLYNVCVSSFNQLFNLLQEPDCNFLGQLSATALEEELGRFRVWAGNSGAHRSGRVSLDHKLREASHVHRMVRELLGDLDGALREAISIVSHERKPFDEQSLSSNSSTYSLEDDPALDPEEQLNPTSELTELQERFGEICHVITCLYKLSITIRNPAPRDRLQKCASIKISHFKLFDIQHAGEKFPIAEKFLKDRLGKANTKRRQLFKYHEKHHDKLAQYIDLPRPGNPLTIQHVQNDEASGGEGLKMTKDDNEDLSERGSPIGKGPSTIAETVNTQTTISTYVQSPSDHTGEVMNLDDSLSQTSYATSIGEIRSTIHVPAPPNATETLGGKPFECPYCYTIISVTDMKFWIKHVYRDLRPYVCTFEDCLKPDHLFDTRHEWYHHEVETHRREWFCNTCCQAFTNKTLSEDHLRQNHPTLFTEAQIPAIAERCERAIDLEQICPLCNEKHTSHRLKNHLARHMQQLALFALPKTTEETDGHGGSLGAQASRSDEEKMENDLEDVELEFDSDPSQGSAEHILDDGNDSSGEIARSRGPDPAKPPLEPNVEITREIERLGIDPALAVSKNYNRALALAAESGYEELIKMLIIEGVDVNVQGGTYENALQAAASGGHMDVVNVLLERGADINAQGGRYGNALQAAASRSHIDVVNVLLERGADVNAQGGGYGNALQAAASRGRMDVVNVLLERGADVNAQGGEYGNALQAAASGGHMDVVNVLLERGADVNAQGGIYGNALQAAASGGHMDVVNVLLERGADVNAQGGEYGNALRAATKKDHQTIITILKANGAS